MNPKWYEIVTYVIVNVGIMLAFAYALNSVYPMY